jgi:hypothetical protein
MAGGGGGVQGPFLPVNEPKQMGVRCAAKICKFG